jgi:hypothetical protein
VTLGQALCKVGDEFDDIAADVLTECEDVLRHRGASAEELEIELSRMRAELADARRRGLQAVRVFAETGGVSWWLH